MSRYSHHLFICQHRRAEDDSRGCCAAKGSAALLDFAKEEVAKRGLKRSVRVNESGCLNACATGPTCVVYPEGIWYALKSEADVRQVLDAHVEGGQPCRALMLPALSSPPSPTGAGVAKAPPSEEPA